MEVRALPANNYGPTTPAPPKKTGRPRAGSARPVAGPSKPSSKTLGHKKTAASHATDPADEEVEFVEVIDGATSEGVRGVEDPAPVLSEDLVDRDVIPV